MILVISEVLKSQGSPPCSAEKGKNHLRARDFWQINNFGKDRKQWENNRKRKVVWKRNF